MIKNNFTCKACEIVFASWFKIYALLLRRCFSSMYVSIYVQSIFYIWCHLYGDGNLLWCPHIEISNTKTTKFQSYFRVSPRFCPRLVVMDKNEHIPDDNLTKSRLEIWRRRRHDDPVCSTQAVYMNFLKLFFHKLFF